MNCLKHSGGGLALLISAIATLNLVAASAEALLVEGPGRFSYWQRLCQLQRDQDYRAAQSACGQALRINPDAGEIWLTYSQILLRAGQYSEAIAAAAEAFELGEQPSLALTVQCMGWFELGQPESGLAACDRALDLDTGWGEASPVLAAIYRGRLLTQQMNYAAALETYGEALALSPGNSQILTHQCEALLALESYDEARQSCDAAIASDLHWGSLHPAVAHYTQGMIYQAEGAPVEAVAAFDRAIRLDSGRGQFWIALGAALAQLGRSEEALSAYTRALDLQPDSFSALLGRCAMLNQTGDYGEAVSACDQAIAADEQPQFAQAWIEKAQALAGQADYPAALAAVNRAIGLQPEDADAWNHRGVLLWYLNDFPGAIAALQRSAAIAPDDPRAYANLARMLRSSGQLEPALEAYDEALELDATDSRIWGDRSGTLWALERYGAALESADRAIELDANQYLGWFNRAAALAALGRNADAIAAYQQALRINPQSADAWTGLGAVLGQLNRYAEAETALATALNINPQQPVAQALLRSLPAVEPTGR